MSGLVDRLVAVLDDRAGDLKVQEEYYRGDLPRLVLPDRTLPSYRTIVEQARSPWGELVIDAASERMQVTGFRVITPEAAGDDDVQSDALAWDIWQGSKCDTWAPIGFTTMLKHGVSYLLVEPGPDLPLLSFEHPSVAATLTAPGGRSTAAAIKRWTDGNLDIAVVWTAQGAQTLVRDRTRGSMDWEPAPEQTVANTTGTVPMFPLKNRPDELGGFRSDLDSLYTTIDRATQSLADRITTQFFASTKVRYLLGVEPELNEDGTPTNATLKLATDKLLLVENPDATAGVFDASDLRQFIETARSDIGTLAALAKLPSFLLSGDLVNVSAEALRVLNDGLKARVGQRQKWGSAGLSDGMRLALKLAGDERVLNPRTRVEPIWGDIVEPDIAPTATAAVGLVGAGVLSPTGAQDLVLGFTPSERQKLAEYARADALAAQGAQMIEGLLNLQPAPVEEPEPESAVA